MLGRTPQSYCVTQLGSSWCSLGSLPTWQRHPFHLLYMSACTWPSCGHVWRQTIGDLSDDTVACLSESHNYWIWNNPHFKIVSLFKMLLIVWNHFFPQQVWCTMLNWTYASFSCIFSFYSHHISAPPTPHPQTPVLAVVGNDACWSQISREQVPILGSNVACGLAFTGPYICTEYCNRRNRSWFEQSILGHLVVSACIDRFSLFCRLSRGGWWLRW